jgi:hypothetical protein
MQETGRTKRAILSARSPSTHAHTHTHMLSCVPGLKRKTEPRSFWLVTEALV